MDPERVSPLGSIVAVSLDGFIEVARNVLTSERVSLKHSAGIIVAISDV